MTLCRCMWGGGGWSGSRQLKIEATNANGVGPRGLGKWERGPGKEGRDRGRGSAGGRKPHNVACKCVGCVRTAVSHFRKATRKKKCHGVNVDKL
jgi:hypothetical protein